MDGLMKFQPKKFSEVDNKILEDLFTENSKISYVPSHKY